MFADNCKFPAEIFSLTVEKTGKDIFEAAKQENKRLKSEVRKAKKEQTKASKKETPKQ